MGNGGRGGARTTTSNRYANAPQPARAAYATVAASPAARAQLQAMMGRDLSDADVAHMTGAGLGDHVTAQASQTGVRGAERVTFTVRGASGSYEATTRLTQDMVGRLVLEVVGVDVPPEQQGQGIGAAWFRRTVDGLTRVGGVRAITMTAARETFGKYNGYYTWARLGVDGPLPSGARSRLPAQFGDARTVLDVTTQPGGAAWWREHGDQYTGTFDLSAGSQSRAVLAAYQKGGGEVHE